MKIETKFDIGQEVWFIGNKFNGEENSLYMGKIRTIVVVYRGVIFDKESYDITYEVDCGFFANVYGQRLYATKEEAEAKLKEMQDEV